MRRVPIEATGQTESGGRPRSLAPRIVSENLSWRSSGGVLLVGPMSEGPLTGGIETGIRLLLDSRLTRTRQLAFFNTIRIRQRGTGHRERLAWFLRVLYSLGARILHSRVRVVHVKASEGRNFTQGIIYCSLARAMGRRVLLQIHGGSFDTWYRSCRGPARFAIRRGLRIPHELITLSPHWADFVRHLAPDQPVHVVPNGVPLHALPRPQRSNGQDIRVVTLGAIGARKGYFDIVAAAAALRDPRITFVFAGPDEFPGQTEALRRQISAAGVGAQIEIAGVSNEEAKWRLLSVADVFLLPSYNENMPNAVLEGMAAGLPVVCTAVGAVPEMLQDGKGGIFVPPGNPSAIATAVQRLQVDATLRRSMGDSNRAAAAGRFSIERVVDALEDLYAAVD